MGFVTKIKDPADKLDYLIDWRDTTPGAIPVLAEDETITTSTWTAYDQQWVATDELVVHEELNAFDDTTTTGWVSEGLLASGFYYFTNHVVTDQGREFDQTIKIRMKEL